MINVGAAEWAACIYGREAREETTGALPGLYSHPLWLMFTLRLTLSMATLPVWGSKTTVTDPVSYVALDRDVAAAPRDLVITGDIPLASAG